MTSKFVNGLAIAAIASTAFVGVALADDIASGGNGGVSTANSNGGSVSIGSTNSGGSSGIQAVINDAVASGVVSAADIIDIVLGGLSD